VRPPVDGPWEILEIEATRDERLIRRAYARRLKVTHPEDDAEGFQRLRQAYDYAMAWASQPLDQPDEAEEAGEDPPGTTILTVDEQEMSFERAFGAEAAAVPAEVLSPPEPAFPLIEDEAGYRAAFETVEQAAFARDSDPRRVARALEALLGTPALQSIGIYQETEYRLLQLALSEAPFASLLVEPMAKAFQWNPERLGGLTRMSATALQRLEEAKFLKSLFNRDHSRHAAWLALTRPPGRLATLRYRVSDRLAGDVAALLSDLRGQWPWFEALLDPAAVAWWENYLHQPQVRALSLFLAGFGAAFGLLLAWAFGATLKGAVTLLVSVALLAGPFAWTYGVRRPRLAWREKGAEGAPLWVSMGWAPAALAPIGLALAMPTGPFSPGLVVLTGLVLITWAAIVAEPDKRPFGMGAREELGPWTVRAIVYHGFLVFYWLRGQPDGGERWLLVGLAAIAAAACWTAGEDTLLAFWEARTSRRSRVTILATLAAVATAVIWAGFVLDERRAPAAAELAAVALMVILHKVPARRLTPQAVRFRTVAMLGGWIIWPVLTAMAAGHIIQGWMGVWTLWLMSGVVFSSLALIRGEFAPPERKRRPGELY
jgi:hypothetical protein